MFFILFKKKMQKYFFELYKLDTFSALSKKHNTNPKADTGLQKPYFLKHI